MVAKQPMCIAIPSLVDAVAGNAMHSLIPQAYVIALASMKG
jgi:hypothetical protein